MILSRHSKVLVSVLDWGLGHASRTSVVVRRLVDRGCSVTLAGSGRSLELLSADFPDLPVRHLLSFSPRLSGGRCQWLQIAFQTPEFLFRVWREHIEVEKISSELKPDLIISDNRYGVWSRSCRNVFITHQFHPHIAPVAPRWAERFVSTILTFFVRKFDACLVPDVAFGALSGDLSVPVPKDVVAHCVGVLSRMSFVEADRKLCAEPVEWLGVVSGPEPQRSAFAEVLIRRFDGLAGRRVVVCADSARADCISEGGVEVIGFASASLLKGLMLNSRHIVCRSGYSTIMDLAAIGRLDNSVELIPTPGQAEQEFLAERIKSGACCNFV